MGGGDTPSPTPQLPIDAFLYGSGGMTIRHEYTGASIDLVLSDGTLCVKSSDNVHSTWDKTDLKLGGTGGVPSSYLYECQISPATSGASSFVLTVEVNGYAPCTITVVNGVCTGPW